ncbi:SGNH/GDSL hydrolase family protein [Caulobacter sp. UNC279MFTsu5.1]|uniref:SGNH/GDSL hydrolase family protein n=1 Tax=Caulobacter sp. UNC279MFTsu5.1 TaxID=1502775 RepID=UPI0008E65CD6|nr:SGNH/GDSL hydrolase family protein [Caulobacter sp. UNC279MFTsu5.1]SFJ23410.1 Lysophospholipase L1 [Caulobacter sp. UNC279MFTsu5.1]
MDIGKRALVGLAIALSISAGPVTMASAAPTRAAKTERWVASWASAQMIPAAKDALPAAEVVDGALRQTLRLSTGGGKIRVRLSNAFGTEPLKLSGVHVALAAAPGSARIDLASDRALAFSGRPEVTIPAGAEYLSDPIDFPAAPLANLAVTIRFDGPPPAQQTSHPGSRTTSWFGAGDQLAAAELTGGKSLDHWFVIAGVDVLRPAGASLVTFGDSITDGYGVTTNGNNRWPDILAARLQADPRTRGVGVLNAGIGGNRLVLDGLGPNAMARFDRDVLNQAGVRYVILLEGVNDLGTLTREQPASPEAHAALVNRMTASYDQMIRRARERGIKVYGATIMPFGGSGYYHPDAANEQDRQAVNAWIRTPGRFDAVIDFDRLMRDPANPGKLAPAYDSGDGLHPSLAGYKAMADAVPLELFTR